MGQVRFGVFDALASALGRSWSRSGTVAAGALACILGGAGTALAMCNTSTICTSGSCPPGVTGSCTISQTYNLDPRCILDFGDKCSVTVSETGVLSADRPGGSFGIRAQNLTVRGRLSAPGSDGTVAPTIQISVNGDFRTQSSGGSPASIDVKANAPNPFPGSIEITATGSVTLSGQDVSADGGSAGPGGNVTVTGAVISLAGPVHANAAGGLGGNLRFIATAGDVSMGGPVTANGSGSQGDGGSLSVQASGNVVVSAVLEANGVRAGGQGAQGGTITLTALGGNVSTIAGGALHANGSGTNFSGYGGTITLDAADTISVGDAVAVDGPSTGYGGFITLNARAGRVFVSGPLSANCLGQYGYGGEISADAASGISIGAAVQANGAANGNGGSISFTSGAGDVTVDGRLSANAGGRQAWGGQIYLDAFGTITVTKQIEANGLLTSSASYGGYVSLLAGGNQNVLADISAIPGGYIEVFSKNGAAATIAVSSTLDVRSTNQSGVPDGLTWIGPACTVRLSGTLKAAPSTPLFDGANIVEYRGSLDARGARMLADSTALFVPSAGNFISCNCVDANQDGVCDGPSPRCESTPVLTGATITPNPITRAVRLGPCTCGNGAWPEAGEQCDDGNLVSCDGCDFNCTRSSVCGNGVRCGAEDCDDGNRTDGDGCSATCRQEDGWSCNFDFTVSGAPSVCRPICGDGLIKGSGEQCDDGNKANRDGCSATCQREPGWDCLGDSSCTTPPCSHCTARCGDGLVQCGLDGLCGTADDVEACDDGNRTNGDGCDDDTAHGGTCTVGSGYRCSGQPSVCLQGCGNGIRNCGPDGVCDNADDVEQCDDGNNNNDDTCKNNCTSNVCGDGFRNCGTDGLCGNADDVEQCDDSNIANLDGCSATCQVEQGWNCAGNVCVPVCGDGLVQCGADAVCGTADDAEQCDDGGLCVGGTNAGAGCAVNGVSSQCPGGSCKAGSGTLVCIGGSNNAIPCTADGQCPGSQCAPGSGPGCDPNCTPRGCGNAFQTPDEECDDGDREDGNGCEHDCTITACGNGIRTVHEQCDDGNSVDDDGCDSNCTPTACGNGVATSGEQCDDGNGNDADFCKSDCTLNVCGDGTRNRVGYELSTVPFGWIDIAANATSVPLFDDQVSPAIQLPFQFKFFGRDFSQVYISSNGFIGFDANTVDGCCSGGPIPSPGWPGENLIAAFWTDLYPPGGGSYRYRYDTQRSVFVIEADHVPLYESAFGNNRNATVSLQYRLYAGSNRIEIHYRNAQPGLISIVSGGIENGDGSLGYRHYAGDRALVQTAVAYIPTAVEQCDDGNHTNGDTCDDDPANGGNCTATACGNGVVTQGEQCDDGNHTNGDGCDDDATLAGNCTATACGNGVVTTGEVCDDGNRTNGDGCDDDTAHGGSCMATPICGDGILVAGREQCDDRGVCSNNQSVACTVGASGQCAGGTCQARNGDGCDQNCMIESGWNCAGDTCVPICGDGVRIGGEQCDDGNLNNGDGCDENCTPSGCGNGIKSAAEPCDEGICVGGAAAGKSCNSNAQCPAGANGLAASCQPRSDFGNNHNRCVIAANGQCQDAACGDGFVCTAAGCHSGPRSAPEDCDRGTLNGVQGSGCTAHCKDAPWRGCGERLSSWTVETTNPDNRRKSRLVCQDGNTSCDQDRVPPNGQCTFAVDFCLLLQSSVRNSCNPQAVEHIDFLGLGDPRQCSWQSMAANNLVSAVSSLASAGMTRAFGRCVNKGSDAQGNAIQGKQCADSAACNTPGHSDGVCGPALAFTNQLLPEGKSSRCTAASALIAVPAGRTLRLRSLVWGYASSSVLEADSDRLTLKCKAADGQPTATVAPCAAGATPTQTATVTPTPVVTHTPTNTPTPAVTFTPTNTPTLVLPPTLTPTPAQQRFCMTNSADDGLVSRLASTYPPSGATTVFTTGIRIDTRRSWRSTGEFTVSVLPLRFDTSGLPDDAIITAAGLEVHVAGTSDNDGRTLVGEFYAASNWPISAAAYTDVAPTVNAALQVAVGTLLPGQVATIALDPTLANQQVSRIAATGLRLHISGGQPTGSNYVDIAAQDHSTLPDPCLLIDYVRP